MLVANRWTSIKNMGEQVFSIYLRRQSEAIANTRCLDIARRWNTASSNGDCYLLMQELVNHSDEESADQCIQKWRLDEPLADDGLSWFEHISRIGKC